MMCSTGCCARFLNHFLCSFSPPHVKRKKRIEEIGAAFSKSSTVASLYSDLLLDKQ